MIVSYNYLAALHNVSAFVRTKDDDDDDDDDDEIRHANSSTGPRTGNNRCGEDDDVIISAVRHVTSDVTGTLPPPPRPSTPITTRSDDVIVRKLATNTGVPGLSGTFCLRL